MHWNKMTHEQRFWARVDKGAAPDCWLWAGSVQSGGYGQIKVAGRSSTSHRVSWEIHHGAIPAGMMVLHRCDIPRCCNPEHLFLGTAKDNSADMMAKGRRVKRHAPHTRVRKLDDDGVRAIRGDGREAHIVAYEHGVSEGTVYNIRARRRKALVPDAA